jgi:HEAT repeat protein
MLDVEVILRKLAEDQKPWRSRYLAGLAGLSRREALSFQQTWQTLPIETRRRIISALVEVSENDSSLDFSYLFRLCLEDEDEEVRLRSLEGLWEDDDPSLVVPLVKLLKKDPSLRVRAAAASSLGRFLLRAGTSKLDDYYARLVYSALLEAAEMENLEIRRRAIEALACSPSDDERVLKLIEDAYYHPDEGMKASAIYAMGKNANPKWRPFILKELRNPRAAIRYEAARACGEMGLKEAVEILAELAKDKDYEVREAAIWALGNIGGNEARNILINFLAEGDDSIREAVEEALREIEFYSDPLNLYDLNI